MSFCSTLQHHLQQQHPRWTWRVEENPHPGTSVVILSQGQRVPGEVVVSVMDAEGAKLAEHIVRGQAYCDFVAGGKSEAEFAAETSRRIVSEAGLA